MIRVARPPKNHFRNGYLELTKNKPPFLDWVRNKLQRKENRFLKISFPSLIKRTLVISVVQQLCLETALIHLGLGLFKILYKSWPVYLSLIQKKRLCFKNKSIIFRKVHGLGTIPRFPRVFSRSHQFSVYKHAWNQNVVLWLLGSSHNLKHIL